MICSGLLVILPERVAQHDSLLVAICHSASLPSRYCAGAEDPPGSKTRACPQIHVEADPNSQTTYTRTSQLYSYTLQSAAAPYVVKLLFGGQSDTWLMLVYEVDDRNVVEVMSNLGSGKVQSDASKALISSDLKVHVTTSCELRMSIKYWS